MASPWSCARCTFQNDASAGSCVICMHKRPLITSNRSTNNSSIRTPAAKKPKTKIASKTTGGMASFLLGSVGSSKEQEAKKLAKKVQQMRELGIELPDERIVELLARNVYCVHVAASEYFERLTTEQDYAHSSSSGAAAGGSHKDPYVATAAEYFETAFLGPPFRLLGSTTVRASVTRKNVPLSVGSRLLFQGENVGNKRARPGSASSSVPASVSAAASTVNSMSPALASPPPVTSTANGIVRISTMDHVQLGRLDREMEVVFHPLLKEGLVALGGVCVEPPFSSEVFASFRLLLFVFVHPRAFEIFQDSHALFHLSDALFYVLHTIHSGAGDKTPLTEALASSSGEDHDPNSDAAVVPKDLETLFSAFAGPTVNSAADQEDAAVQELVPLFKDDFALRSHQKQALSWMLWRETQANAASTSTGDKEEDANPLWEKRLFHSKEIYYINPFEKIASFEPPAPPTPCLGGILADDMGMGKTIMLLSLVAHRKHFGNASGRSPPAEKNNNSKAGRVGKTLIVCPLSLLHQWKNEVEDRFRPQTLSVFVYYGDDRSSGSLSTKSDVVLTTYGVLSSEFEKSSAASVLLSTEWDRVILDEAHSIKNRSTTYFRACAALRATHRWCLTGTPLQNSLSDLFSLLCFLNYEPWSRVAWWQRVIARPFEQGDEEALARLKVLLKPILLRRTKLSRDANGKNIVELPPKTIELVRLQFSEEERAFYEAVYDRSRAEFNGFVSSGTSMSSYIAIFALLLRLRQACNHPFLALGRNSELAEAKNGNESTGPNSGASKALRLERLSGESMESYFHRITARLEQDAAATTEVQSSSDANGVAAPTAQYIQNVLTQIREEGIDAQECPICLDPPQRGVLTPCAHLLCEECLRDSVASDPEGGCPVCRAPVEMSKVFAISTDDVAAAPAAAANAEQNQQQQQQQQVDEKTSSLFLSSKLRQLIRDLQKIRAEDEQQQPVVKRKVVVFSQWMHMLEMVAELLGQFKFRSCMFHGSMNQEAREKVLHKFSSDPDMDVLVISLKAGGVGLNLTCASVVVLLDPWWNPGVEDQAIDRVHRLGQSREVVVKRYVVEETVEEMILQLQQRKEKLAKNVLVAAKSADDRASERLSMQDLLAFFK